METQKNITKEIKGKNCYKPKQKNKIKIATWNIRTMLQPGKMQEIVDEIKRYGIDIAAIQETRWKGQGEISKNNFTLRYSGAEKQGQYGVGFIIMGKLKESIMEFNPISERMAYLRIETKPFNLSILNIYAPTEVSSVEEKETFYDLLEEEIEKMPKEDTRLIMGDFNAQIGKEKFIEKVAGKQTIHEKTNDNGLRLCNLATSSDLIISSTKFKHKNYHKVTWIAPDQSTYTQIDHVLIARRMRSSILDVRTYRGAMCDSDHFMVTTTIRQKVKRNTKNKNTRCKWDIKKLNEESIRNNYEKSIQGKLVTPTEEDIEAEWNKIKTCINEAAKESIGEETRQKKREWYNEDCRKVIQKRNKTRLVWLNSNKEKDRKEYEIVRKECKKSIRETKRRWMENKIKEIEQENEE